MGVIMKKKIQILLMFFIFVLFIAVSIKFVGCGGGGGTPAGATLIATVNSSHMPQISLNSRIQVVWVLQTDSESAIYLYSGGRVTKITSDDTVRYRWPQINGNGQVIWFQNSSGESTDKLYVYKNGMTTEIAQAVFMGMMPWQNSEGAIVWSEWVDYNRADVKMYFSGNITTITDSLVNILPQINASNMITWMKIDDDVNIEMFSHQYNQEQQLSADNLRYFNEGEHGGVGKNNIVNSSGTIIWLGREDYFAPLQVFRYSGGTATQITDTPSSCYNPQLADNDHIVWQTSVDNGAGTADDEIYHYQNGVITRITDNDVQDEFPSVNSRGVIVWQAYDGNDSEIFYYYNGNTTQLTDNDIDDVLPQVSESNQVVWLTQEWGGNEYVYKDIYLQSVSLFASKGTNINRNWVALKTRLGRLYSKAKKFVSNTDIFKFGGVAEAQSKNLLLRFWVSGDSRWKDGCIYGGKQINDDWVQNFAQYAKQQGPDAIFYSGDFGCLSMNTPHPDGYNIGHYWLSFISPAINDAGIPLYPIKGNHDIYLWGAIPDYAGNTQSAYRKIFGMEGDLNKDLTRYDITTAGNAKGFTFVQGPENYEFLDYYVWHEASKSIFIVMDTYYISPGDHFNDGYIDSNQLTWLNNITTTGHWQNAEHKFFFTHAPVFSPDKDPNKDKVPDSMIQLWDFLQANEFSAFYSGHIHLFSYVVITDSPFVKSPLPTPNPNPVPQFVVGAGGAYPDSVGSAKWTEMVEYIRAFCEVRIYDDGSEETSCWQNAGNGDTFDNLVPIDLN